MEKDCKTDGRNNKEDEERGVRLTEETTGYQAINHLRRETRKRAWGAVVQLWRVRAGDKIHWNGGELRS